MLSTTAAISARRVLAAELLAALYVKVLKLDPSIAPPISRTFAGPPGARNSHSFTGVGYHGKSFALGGIDIIKDDHAG